MKNPLIPFKHYEEYGRLSELSEADRFIRMKELVNELDILRKNTLKFLLEFFRELVSYEGENLMTSYNVAVTVGPNIFRSKNNLSSDILNHAIYYETMIRMIESYEQLFDEKSSISVDLNSGAVGSHNAFREDLGDDDGEEGEDGDLLMQMQKADDEADEQSLGEQVSMAAHASGLDCNSDGEAASNTVVDQETASKTQDDAADDE